MSVTDFNYWQSMRRPYTLAQSGVPVILSSSATAITATGAVSGATALPYTPTGVAQVFMFLAARGGANQLYYARYSSATAFQLYLDAAGTITPTGLTAGAYAGGTSEVTLSGATVPGRSMGATGSLQIDKQYSMANTAGVKTFREYWGGVVSELLTPSGQPGFITTKAYQNRGEGVQVRVSSFINGWGFTPTAFSSADTTQDVVLTMTAQLATASDYAILERYRIVIFPGA